jgi:hypothetical protein
MTTSQKKEKIKRVKSAYLINRKRKLEIIRAAEEKRRLIAEERKKEEEKIRLKQLEEEKDDFLRILNKNFNIN